jgi:beta-phosphoglucomutase-like phosphatase (HAD superfamily)
LISCACVAVEDAQNGAVAAINAGMRTVVVPDLAPILEEIKSVLFCECKTLSEIIKLL